MSIPDFYLSLLSVKLYKLLAYPSCCMELTVVCVGHIYYCQLTMLLQNNL